MCPHCCFPRPLLESSLQRTFRRPFASSEEVLPWRFPGSSLPWPFWQLLKCSFHSPCICYMLGPQETQGQGEWQASRQFTVMCLTKVESVTDLVHYWEPLNIGRISSDYRTQPWTVIFSILNCILGGRGKSFSEILLSQFISCFLFPTMNHLDMASRVPEYLWWQ